MLRLSGCCRRDRPASTRSRSGTRQVEGVLQARSDRDGECRPSRQASRLQAARRIRRGDGMAILQV